MSRVVVLLILFVLAGCSDPNSLTPEAFQERIKATPDAIVIDVRTPEETHTSGIIEGAIVYDFKSGEFENSVEALDKSKTYFLYCASGVRSSKAAGLMKKQGFEKVFVLEGGTTEWTKRELPLAPIK